MYSLKINKRAKETLDYLKKIKHSNLSLIIFALDEIVLKGISSSNTKSIGNKIYRKRVGRWRILFTIKGKVTYNIWIIELEKNTKKDYKKWKLYIINRLKIGL